MPPDTEARLASFTELVATAISNAENLAELAASRARVVAAADQTRRQIERDLHDGAQQRLVSLALALRAAQAAVPPGLGDLGAELANVAEGLVNVMDDLREMARGIHPGILSEGGLAPALKMLARRSAVPVQISAAAGAGRAGVNFSTGQQEPGDCHLHQRTTGANGDVAPGNQRHAVCDGTIEGPVMSGVGSFQRRSFLQAVAGGVAATVVADSVAPGVARAAPQDDYNLEATRDGLRTVPFYGPNQAGIGTPPQTAASFLAFDVTAANRSELTALFRTLTARAAFLTVGGTPPPTPATSPPSDDRLLGPTVLPDDLTVTIAVGASLFDGRYGLGPTKPAQLETMRAFAHDNLDPAISGGDLLVQLCAGHRDTVGHAMLDILASTSGGTRLRWRIDGFRFPPRPVGIPRDWMGFKDGITNPDTTNTAQMNQEVWVQPGAPEPAWTAGGTYQVVRIIRMFLDKWNVVPVEQQERVFGRRKISGAPLYATSPTASDMLDPVYTNDPDGLLTPLNCHIRLANPQTPQTAATSAILRRSFQYDRSPDVQGSPDMGHVFCCFQQQLATYIAMQTRLEDEMLVPFISPVGGGYFFALPGVSNPQDYYGRALLT